MDNIDLPPSIPPKKNRRSIFHSSPTEARFLDPNPSDEDNVEKLPPSFTPRRHSVTRGLEHQTNDGKQTNMGPVPIVRKSKFIGREGFSSFTDENLPQNFTLDNPEENTPNSEKNKNNPVKPPISIKKRIKRIVGVCLLFIFILLAVAIAWPAWLIYSTEDSINHVQALSNMPNSKGETWLIAGSDKRSSSNDGGIQGRDVGARTDSLMLVRNAGGTSMIVSLPRDTVVEIPGYKGVNKLNAAYALGGPKLLVKTVEKLSGVKINHYVEVSMGAVTQIIDAEGGVQLCYPDKVDDHDSGLKWPGGCQLADGKTSLAFSRMRYADPRGDFGRQERQRQVLSQMVKKAQSNEVLYSPSKQKALAKVVAKNLDTDPDTGIVTLGRLAWAYRDAQKAGLSGNPPIGNPNYSDGIHGSMVLLDREKSADFWQSFLDGSLSKDQYHSFK